MFPDKGFVGGTNAVLYSGFVDAAIVDTDTAVTVAGKKLLGNSAGQPTSAIFIGICRAA